MKKKILIISVLLLIFCLSFSLISIYKNHNIYEYGNGEKETPFVIANEKQLKAFRNQVNKGNDYDNVYFELGNDIDLSSSNWLSIGKDDKNKFKGNFDGKNYSITGLKVNGSFENNVYYGLFGYVEEAYICNLNITEANIQVKSETDIYVATLAAFSKDSKIENCYSSSDIKAISSTKLVVGGLVAFSNGEVLRSLSNASITNFDDLTDVEDTIVKAGALIGENYGKVDTSAAGSSTVTFDRLKSSKTYVGSLIGFGEKKYVSRSYYSEQSIVRGTNQLSVGESAVKLSINSDSEYYASFNYETNTYKLKFTIINEELKTASVSGFEYIPSTTCEVNVPSYVDIPNDAEGTSFTTYAVSEVGDKTFSTSKVHRVNLPETITKIGEKAFQNASQIQSFDFPSNLITLGDYAFAGCTALKSIILPESLQYISKGAFDNCISVDSAEKLQLPNDLKEIGDEAFKSIRVQTITFPDSLEKIGNNAFENSLLVVVNFGLGLKEIGNNAFTNNELLKYVYFSGVAPKCGENIFYLEDEKENVKIYYNEKASGWNYDCVGLSNTGKWTANVSEVYWTVSISTNNILEFVPTLDNEFDTFDQQGVQYRVNKSDQTAIIIGSKEDCSNKIVIPDVVIYDTTILKVTKINANAFVNRNITKVTVGQNVQAIESKAFVDCNSLESVFIMSQEEIVITSNSFYFATPKNIEVVYTELAYGKEATIGITNYYSNHILINGYDEQGILYTIVNDGEKEYAVVGSDYKLDDERANTSYYNGSDYYSGVPGKAIIPDYVSVGDKYYRVVSLGRYAFYNSQSLKDIELGAFIGYYQENNPEDEATLPGVWDCSFRECLYLNNFSVDSRNTKYFIKNDGKLLCYIKNPGTAGESVQIVKASIDIKVLDASEINLTAIAPYAFANCSHLTSIELIDNEAINVVNVGKHAFENTALTNVDLTKMFNIGDEAFANCFDIEKVTIGEETVLGYHVFKNCYSIQKFYSNNPDYFIDSHGALYKLKEENGASFAVLMQYPASNYRIDKDFTENYHVNFITLQDSTRLPVYLIDEYAFAYSRLKNVIIGENVLSIGKAAFMNCGALKRIEISQNLVYIGMEIDHEITIETLENELSNGERTKLAYEQEVFDNCYVLSQIIVDEDNRFYYADDNGVLYNKDKSTLLVYGQGISRLTYTIPQSVEYIALEAFQKNTHLQRVTIPESVKEIGAKAFNGCTNLTWIYFRTIEAPKLNDQVFNSCGVNTDKEYTFVNVKGETVKTKFAIYCIPNPGVWYESYSYLWENYFVEKYNSIQEVENEYVENVDIYTLLINDSDGNSISDLNITIESNGRPRAIKSNELGFAIFTVPDQESLINGNAVKITILDPNDIYYDYIVEEYVLDFSTYFSHITLTSKPVVDGLFYNDIDIQNGYIASNILTYAELDEDNNYAVKKDAKGNVIYNDLITITVQIQWDNIMSSLNNLQLYYGDQLMYTHEFLSENSLIENNKVMISSKFINSTQKDSGNGIGVVEFTFEPSFFERYDLEKENDIKAVLNTSNNTRLLLMPTEKILRFHIIKHEYVYEDILPEAIDLALNNSMFDSVPLLKKILAAQEDSLKIKFNKILKLNIKYDNDKLTIALNIGNDIWDGVKNSKVEGKYFKNTFDSLKQAIGRINASKAFNGNLADEDSEQTKNQTLSWEIGGCMEISFTSETRVGYISQLYLTGELKIKREASQTVVVAGYPFIIGAEVSASGKITYSIVKFDDSYNADYINPLKVQFKVGMEVFGGVGCSFISLSIYGEIGMKLALEMQLIEEKFFRVDEWALTFDAGIQLKIKLGMFTIKHKVSFFELLDVDKNLIILEYDEELKDYVWFPQFKDGKSLRFKKLEDAVAYYLKEASRSFREWECEEDYSKYDGIEFEYIEYNGELYRFYIDNVYANPVFDTLVGYDKYNYLKLVYQIQNLDGTWSNPQIINDSLFNDCEFEIKEINGELVVVYSSLNTKLDANNLENYAEYVEMYTCTIDSVGLNESSKIYSNDETTSFDINTVEYDNKTYISWIDNSDMNPVGLSNDTTEDADGTITFNTTNNNTLNICCLDDGTIEKVEGLTYIPYTEFIELNNVMYLAYVLDEDCNTTTSTDRRINLLNLDTYEIVEVFEQGQYQNIVYSNETVYANIDGDLATIKLENSEFVKETILENVDESSKIIFDESGNLYALASINTYVSEDGTIEYSNISVRMYDEELKEFGENVQITHIDQNKNYVEYYTTYWDNESKLHFAYTYSILNIDSNDNEYYDYYENDIIINKEFDISLNVLEVEKTSVKDNEDMTFYVNVSNNSLEKVTSLTFELSYGSEVISSKTLDEVLLSGESKNFEINTKFINKGIDKYTITVTGDSKIESNITNNSKDISLVFTDLFVNAKFVEIANIPYLLVVVRNDGLAASGKSYIYVNSGTYSMDENVDTNDALYSLEIAPLAVGEYKYYTIELNKVFFVDNSATVYVITEGEEVKTTNNFSAVSMIPNEVSSKRVHRLNYYVNDELKYTVEYEKGAIIDPYSIPFVEGHTFTGWLGMLDNMPDYDLNVYGFLQANEYTISYNVKVRDGFNEEYNDTYVYNSEVVERTLTKVGHTFDGWYLDEALTIKADLDINMPADNITVYGKYNVNEYFLNFYVDGERIISNGYYYNSSITYDEYIPNEGYTFSGWTSIPEIMPAYDINVYGYTTINTYKVSYYVDNVLYKQNEVQYNTDLVHPTYTAPIGYTFNGFEYSLDKMPANDISIYATTTANTYYLNYYIDNTLYQSVPYTYGQEISALEYNGQPSGFTFSGWDNVPETMPANNVNVYATVDATMYDIIYLVDGEEMFRDSFAYGSKVTFRESPEKEGYTFSGWDTEIEYMPLNGLTINGTFAINSYKINYYINGEKVYVQELEYNEEISAYEYSAPIGYDFSGWYEIPETMPASDVNVYALLSAKIYKLQYYVDNQLVEEFEYPYNAIILEYPYIVASGYTFNGWENHPQTMPASNTKIYGTTSINEYNINYYVNGKLVETVKYPYNATIEAYNYVPENGITFLGFADVPAKMPASDINVYGFEAAKVYTITYYIDNELYAIDTYVFNQTVHEKVVDTKEGYTFSGWDKKPSSMPSENIEIHGTYIVNQYKVKYYVEGLLVYTDSFAYQSEITIRPNETKKGYTFSGWSTYPSVMPAHDVSLYASFEKNVYKVQYYIGAELYKVEEYYYNDNINLIKDIDMNGYDFNGWKLDGQKVNELKMDAKDIILNADMVKAANKNMPLIIIGSSIGGSLILSTTIFCLFKFSKKRKK